MSCRHDNKDRIYSKVGEKRIEISFLYDLLLLIQVKIRIAYKKVQKFATPMVLQCEMCNVAYTCSIKMTLMNSIMLKK